MTCSSEECHLFDHLLSMMNVEHHYTKSYHRATGVQALQGRAGGQAEGRGRALGGGPPASAPVAISCSIWRVPGDGLDRPQRDAIAAYPTHKKPCCGCTHATDDLTRIVSRDSLWWSADFVLVAAFGALQSMPTPAVDYRITLKYIVTVPCTSDAADRPENASTLAMLEGGLDSSHTPCLYEWVLAEEAAAMLSCRV